MFKKEKRSLIHNFGFHIICLLIWLFNIVIYLVDLVQGNNIALSIIVLALALFFIPISIIGIINNIKNVIKIRKDIRIYKEIEEVKNDLLHK